MIKSLLSDLPFTRGFSRNLGESKRGTAAFVLAAFISGDPLVGSVLTVNTNGTNAVYQWKRNGVNIAGATTVTYTAVLADAGNPVTCEVTADEGTITSNALSISEPLSAPVMPTGAGSISGNPVAGSTLTYAPASDVTGNPEPETTVEWFNDSDDTSAGTGLTLSAPEGTGVYVRETNTNSEGSVSADTLPTGAIAPAPAVVTLTGLTQASANDPVNAAFDTNKTTTVEVVIFAAGSPDPDAADFDTGAVAGYIDLGPATLTILGTDINVTLPDGLDGSYKIAVLPENGGDLDVAVSPAATINTVPASAGMTVTDIAPQASSASGTTTDYTLDLSAFPSGGKLIVGFGNNSLASAMTLGVNTGTLITENSANAGQLMSLYEIDFAAGTASDTLTVTHTSSNSQLVGMIVTSGAEVVDTDQDWNQSGSPLTTTVTTTDASNAVVHFAMTNGQADGIGSWTGSVETGEDNVPQGHVHVARSDDEAVGAVAVTATPLVASGRLVLTSLVLEPV